MKYLLLGTIFATLACSIAHAQSFNSNSLFAISPNSLQGIRDRSATPPPAPPTQAQLDYSLGPSRWGTVGQQVGQKVWGSYGPPIGTLSGAPAVANPVGAPVGSRVGATAVSR